MAESLAILNRIRWVALIGQSILLFISIYYYEIKLPLTIISIIIFVEAIFIISTNQLLKRGFNGSKNKVILHILFDSLTISGLIYFSGGANNPFIYLLLLYVALGSFMLQSKQLFILVIIELTLYSLLNIYQHPLVLAESSPLSSFHFHLAGMWVNFFLTVILLAVFGLITRSSLIKQEKKLQKLREKHLQDEQILGLGIMSANAAHELGTPLSTMAIVIDDIQHGKISDEQQQDMILLQNQILRCRNIIGRLSEKSQHAQQQIATQSQIKDLVQSPIEPLKIQLERIIERWLVYQPKIILSQHWETKIDDTYFQISISLEQAITNLLDNASDASLENSNNEINVGVYLSDEHIVIDIKDNGLGISKQNKLTMGKQIQPSKKQDGLGWGMFLSNVSIERVGGSVHIVDYQDDNNSGSLTRMKLPKGGLDANK